MGPVISPDPSFIQIEHVMTKYGFLNFLRLVAALLLACNLCVSVVTLLAVQRIRPVESAVQTAPSPKRPSRPVAVQETSAEAPVFIPSLDVSGPESR